MQLPGQLSCPQPCRWTQHDPESSYTARLWCMEAYLLAGIGSMRGLCSLEGPVGSCQGRHLALGPKAGVLLLSLHKGPAGLKHQSQAQLVVAGLLGRPCGESGWRQQLHNVMSACEVATAVLAAASFP